MELDGNARRRTGQGRIVQRADPGWVGEVRLCDGDECMRGERRARRRERALLRELKPSQTGRKLRKERQKAKAEERNSEGEARALLLNSDARCAENEAVLLLLVLLLLLPLPLSGRWRRAGRSPYDPSSPSPPLPRARSVHPSGPRACLSCLTMVANPPRVDAPSQSHIARQSD